jgi:hypothetical protein
MGPQWNANVEANMRLSDDERMVLEQRVLKCIGDDQRGMLLYRVRTE